MIPKTLRSFIARLHDVTDSGDVEWREGAPEAYYCDHNAFEIHLSYRFDGDTGESSFHFLLKGKGREAFFATTNGESDYDTMRNLYASVNVRAAGFGNIEEEFFS